MDAVSRRLIVRAQHQIREADDTITRSRGSISASRSRIAARSDRADDDPYTRWAEWKPRWTVHAAGNAIVDEVIARIGIAEELMRLARILMAQSRARRQQPDPRRNGVTTAGERGLTEHP
jgi:hypothetical protein